MTPTIFFREMSPLAQARHVQQLMAANVWSLTQVAAHLGEYASFLSFRLALLDLPAERQTLLEGGGLSIAQALREVRGLPSAPSLKPVGAGAATGQLLYLPVSRLRLHPSNIRRYYPEADVQQMAESLLAHGGVLQALLIIGTDQLGEVDRELAQVEVGEDLYYVVDGNLRLAAARWLGGDMLLKCEVISADRAQQLLAMLTTSEFFFPKDPISMALHFRRLIEEEGLSLTALSRETGHSYATLTSYLKLLDLDPDIQTLVAQGKLPRSSRMSEALLSVPDPGARVKLAARLAQRPGVTLKVIETACQRLKEQLEHNEAKEQSRAPVLLLAAQDAPRRPTARSTVSVPAVRAAARLMCEACDLRAEALAHVPEPAWLLVVQAAEATCQVCSVRDVKDACECCPSVDLLKRLMKEVASGPG